MKLSMVPAIREDMWATVPSELTHTFNPFNINKFKKLFCWEVVLPYLATKIHKNQAIPKKGSAKECSNYCITALISHTSKVMLKIFPCRLQQYVNRELPDVQTRFRKGRGFLRHTANLFYENVSLQMWWTCCWDSFWSYKAQLNDYLIWIWTIYVAYICVHYLLGCFMTTSVHAELLVHSNF